ncbi:hypothetical protein LCGC14_1511840 [marine sediment metagenome]|uniref:Uncharacterized protein n=1 Tax=marine sediment metagenome TaxID=412755 RepID=A0A0F9JLW8_9ZZZZ
MRDLRNRWEVYLLLRKSGMPALQVRRWLSNVRTVDYQLRRLVS